jgi:hypothetical protein
VTGAPALSTSLVSFDCRLVDERLVSTHHVMMGEILAIRFGAPGRGSSTWGGATGSSEARGGGEPHCPPGPSGVSCPSYNQKQEEAPWR